MIYGFYFFFLDSESVDYRDDKRCSKPGKTVFSKCDFDEHVLSFDCQFAMLFGRRDVRDVGSYSSSARFPSVRDLFSKNFLPDRDWVRLNFDIDEYYGQCSSHQRVFDCLHFFPRDRKNRVSFDRNEKYLPTVLLISYSHRYYKFVSFLLRCYHDNVLFWSMIAIMITHEYLLMLISRVITVSRD